MGVTRRRFVRIAAQSAAIVIVPVLKLAAPVVPCVQAIRGRFHSIPFKPLRSSDIKSPGRWGG